MVTQDVLASTAIYNTCLKGYTGWLCVLQGFSYGRKALQFQYSIMITQKVN